MVHDKFLLLCTCAVPLVRSLLLGEGVPAVKPRPELPADWMGELTHLRNQPDNIDTKGSRPRLSGFARAKRFNTCQLKGKDHDAGGLLPVWNHKFKAIYMFQDKAGTNTIRNAAAADSRICYVCDEEPGFTRFTVVRDPLERSISAFWQEGWTCKQGPAAVNNPSQLASSISNRAHVLDMFEGFVSELEKGSSCCGPHAERQTHRLPEPYRWPMQWIGNLGTLEQDWQELSEHKAEHSGIQWPELPSTQHLKPTNMHSLLNVTLLPAALAQRICEVYKDDYCCLGLAVPGMCKLTC